MLSSEQNKLFLDFIELADSMAGNIFASGLFSSVCKIVRDYTGVHRNCVDLYTSEQKKKVAETISVANEILLQGCNENSIKKIIASLCIYKYFNKSYMNEVSVSDELKKKFKEHINSLKIDINVQDNASYNEKKSVEKLYKAEQCADYKEILKFFDQIKIHGNTFFHTELSVVLLVRFIWNVDKQIVIEKLVASNPFEIEFFLYSLYGNILDIFSNLKLQENIYLELRIKMLIFHQLDSKGKDETAIYDLCRKMSKTDIGKLFDNFENELEYIPAMRISHLISFNYLLGTNISKYPDRLELYLNNADFGIRATKAFSRGILDTLKDKNIMITLIEKIEKYFFENEIKSFDVVNKYTGYVDLFICEWCIEVHSKEDYIERLQKIANCIESQQESWNQDTVINFWIALFYGILANKNLNYDYSDSEIQQYLPVLHDKRNELIHGDVAAGDKLPKNAGEKFPLLGI
ncbi:MAG: hypothetical protein IJY51_06560 [Treponema sp.]|uniref:hypothetical protein n=1 Tax=Treponema sp. TaxID=166 RepID=UPI00257C51C8|nr:hypothetical protein [Treponema sp.]MBQ9102725.1 hypothetical protein [Treponema sp.]